MGQPTAMGAVLGFSEKLIMSFANLETQASVVSENSIAIAAKK